MIEQIKVLADNFVESMLCKPAFIEFFGMDLTGACAIASRAFAYALHDHNLHAGLDLCVGIVNNGEYDHVILRKRNERKYIYIDVTYSQIDNKTIGKAYVKNHLYNNFNIYEYLNPFCEIAVKREFEMWPSFQKPTKYNMKDIIRINDYAI